jgi:hypothetical protein
MDQQENKTRENNFDDMVDQLYNMQEKAAEAINDPENTDEDGEKDPSLILLDSILKNTTSMLQTDTMIDIFGKLKGVFGEEVLTALVEALSLLMSYSAHSALVTYDGLLSERLKKEFGFIDDHMNKIKAVVDGHDAVLQVHNKTIEAIKRKIQIDDFSKNNNI